MTDRLLSSDQMIVTPMPCSTARESWNCPNMKPVEGDTDMEYEHYECKVCGRTMRLDYEEMK